MGLQKISSPFWRGHEFCDSSVALNWNLAAMSAYKWAMFQSGYNADDKIQVHKWSIRASEAISKIKCVMAIFNGQFEQTATCRFSQQKRELLPVLLHSLEPIPISEHSASCPPKCTKQQQSPKNLAFHSLEAKAKCWDSCQLTHDLASPALQCTSKTKLLGSHFTD